MVSKARRWINDDQSNWSKLAHGKDEDVKISPKAKVYVKVILL